MSDIKNMNAARKQKIQTLIDLLKKYRVRVDGVLVTKVNLSSIENIKENEIVNLSWRENNLGFSVILTEEGVAAADFFASHVEVEDHEGDPLTLEFIDDRSRLIQIKV